MPKPPRRRGQHDVHALVRVYSAEGDAALYRIVSGRTALSTTADKIQDAPWRLWQVRWRPVPSRNEGNTEHDFRTKLHSLMGGLWYDTLEVEYRWSPLDEA